MGMKLNDINGEASERVFGFKATSRSIKPVHLAQTIFAHSLGHVYSSEDLFEFLEKPSKTPSEELDDELIDLFESNVGSVDEEYLDELRWSMRLVLANDNALYSTETGSAPTSTSERLVIRPSVGVTPGRYIYTLMDKSSGDVEDRVVEQLTDRHDAVSVLFRPLIEDAEKGSYTTKTVSEPEMGEMFGDGSISTEFVEGYSVLGRHLKKAKKGYLNYPRDLRRVVKYGCFAMYAYLINRHNEIRAEDKRQNHVPLLFDYTKNEDNPVADASLDCVRVAHSEVQLASRVGIRDVLDTKGYRSYDRQEIDRQIEEKELLDLKRKSQSKIDEDYEKFREILESDTSGDTFEKLVNTVSDAIHHSSSRFKTYTPQMTVQTFGWRMGLLKPRGNRANKRRFRPDPEILEVIILSVMEPGETASLGGLAERLREKYGIIVGGTEHDREHLSEWGVQIGASSRKSDPLNNENYDGFKNAVASIGLADEYADGVTIVSAPEGQ